MKKVICFIFFMFVSFSAFSESKRSDFNREIEEIMKAREEMLKSLLNDSGFQNFNFDDHFDDHFNDLVKKFEQDSFSAPGMETGAVVGEYDWKETDKDITLLLKVKQIKDKPLDIKIEKGQIKLKGDVESSEVDRHKKTKQITRVHFERIFSIPEGVDQTNPQFDNSDGQLRIKFKKLESNKTATPHQSIQRLKGPAPTDREPIGTQSGDTKI